MVCVFIWVGVHGVGGMCIHVDWCSRWWWCVSVCEFMWVDGEGDGDGFSACCQQ